MAKKKTRPRSKIDQLLDDEEFQSLDQLVRLGKKAVPELKRILSRDSDTLRRQRAAIVLGRIPHAEADDVLVKALKDREPAVVLSSLDALVRLKSPKCVDYVKNLLKSRDVSIRCQAAKAIGQLGSEGETALLEKVIAEDDSEYVRLEASKSLERLQPR
jgi:hypothetical protein